MVPNKVHINLITDVNLSANSFLTCTNERHLSNWFQKLTNSSMYNSPGFNRMPFLRNTDVAHPTKYKRANPHSEIGDSG